MPLATLVRWVGLALGPILAILLWLLLPPLHLDANGTAISGLPTPARTTAAVAALMAVWWMTEAIPISATALLPLILFPALSVLPFKDAASPYASDVIFLFMGGFILGLAMERWNLHKRVALITVLIVGTGPKRLVAGFMIASAMLSMWVSNTATTIMMLPIALSIITLVHERHAAPNTPEDERRSPDPNFDSTLMLGIAYAASIGGVATLIGSPPNAVFKGFLESTLHQQVTFLGWMTIGLPIVLVFLPIAWFYLTSINQPITLKSIPGGREMIRRELKHLGPITRGEWTVFLVFLPTVSLWILRPTLANLAIANTIISPKNLTDASIALFASLLLFVIPVKPREHVFAMDWKTAQKLPWGALLLFGGGLSLAGAITTSGLDTHIGQAFTSLNGLPVWLIVLLITLVVVFASELASNTAIATALLPVLAAAAPSLHVDPIRLLVPATLAASLAFMLPVGTPPNAIVFATGHTTMRQMVSAGFGLNLLSVVLITVASELLWKFVVVHP